MLSRTGLSFSRLNQLKLSNSCLFNVKLGTRRSVSSQNEKTATKEEHQANDENASKQQHFDEQHSQDQSQSNETKEYIPYSEVAEQPRSYSFKNLHEFDKKEVESPAAIKNLRLDPKVKKVFKQGSFVRNLFLGEFDEDYLAYPEVLKSRHEYKALREQGEVINKYFKGLVMRNPKENLRSFGFDSLWFLTKTEMINIIENVGRSMAVDPHKNIHYNKDHNPIDPLNRPAVHPCYTPDNLKTVLSLIMANTTVAAINSTDNEALKDRIYAELNRNPKLKIAFAWSEKCYDTQLLVDPSIDFESTAKLSADSNYWILSAKKRGIIDEDYDYYMVIASTSDYPENVSRFVWFSSVSA